MVKITVGSDEEKAEILHNCTKICSVSEPEYLSNVFITPDLTKKEREENRALRDKLKIMNNGQNKYQIKNGQIVPRRNEALPTTRLALDHFSCNNSNILFPCLLTNIQSVKINFLNSYI